MLSQDEFALFCKKIDDESILANLCVEPWNSEQLSSILDMLQHIVPTNSKFNLDGKDKLFDFIESSQDIQWLWSECNPKAILYFSECGEVLAVVLQKFKSLLSEMCPDALHEAGVHLAQQLKDSSKLTEFSDAVVQMCDENKTQKQKSLKYTENVLINGVDDTKSSIISSPFSRAGAL